MPRYVIQRVLGNVSETELQEAALHSRQVRESSFPDVTWEHTHVVWAGDGLMTFCVYGAPNEGRVREHARAAGLPADRVYEIFTDVDPERL